MKARGLSVQQGFDGKVTLTVEIVGAEGRAEAKRLFDELRECDLNIAVKKFRKKRSLNANSLCWKLCTEIADVTRSDKDKVYLEMLKRYGQSEVVSVRSDIDVTGYFKYFEEFGKGYVNDREFTHYKIFKGSSEYDSYEMSVLLDGVTSEAVDLGIPVLTDRELSLIKSEWGNSDG